MPCSPLGDLPHPEIEPTSPACPALQVDSLLLSHWRSPQKMDYSISTLLLDYAKESQLGNFALPLPPPPTTHALEISSPNLWLTSTLGIFVERRCKFFWGGGAVLGLQCGKRASPVAMLGFSCPTACGILVPQPGIVLLSPELEKSDSLPLDHQGSSKSCT